MSKLRNTYNTDRLMWLGGFVPTLRKKPTIKTPPIQIPPKLASPNGYPGKQGSIDVAMRFIAFSAMEDSKTKVFVNGQRVLNTPISGYDDFPVIEENDLVTLWVYAPTEELPAAAKVTFTFFPTVSSGVANFPVTISGDFFGYVNGLAITTNTPIGSPVSAGAVPGTYAVQLDLETTKLMSAGEEEIGQLVFNATAVTGKETEIGYRLQVVMCEKLERYQAVQRTGVAGGPFIYDAAQVNAIYPDFLSDPIMARCWMYQPFTQLTPPALVPSYSQVSQDGQYSMSHTLSNVVKLQAKVLPTATYNGFTAFATILNTLLVDLSPTLVTGSFVSPTPPPGSDLTFPSYSVTVASESFISFGIAGKRGVVFIRQLDLPEGYTADDAVYVEVVLTSTFNKSSYKEFYTYPAHAYTYPPYTYTIESSSWTASTGNPAASPIDIVNFNWDGGSSPSLNQVVRVMAQNLVGVPAYVLSQYVDPETPEINPIPGRAIYIQLTASVELSDSQYAEMRAAGVASLSDFEKFVADNPDVGNIRTETDFDLDLTTQQMQSVLGTDTTDPDKAEALFALLSSGFKGSEDFLAAQGNSVQTKVYPYSPSAMDQLKMAGKVLSGVNSLLTLGKLLANIGVLTTPVGILVAINTGINIYNAVEVARGISNNRMPQYIPTVNETFYNAFKPIVTPAPNTGGIPRQFQVPPTRIP